MTAKELTRLIEAHLDGHLTEAEAQALSRELADHPAARRQFWDQAATHGLMQEAARLTWLKMAAPEAPPKIARIDWSRWRAPLAAAAAFLILGLVWWLGGAHEQPSRGVAVLARAVGAEWETDENTLSPGAVLSAGILRLKSGAAAIDFYSGARVVLEAPAEF